MKAISVLQPHASLIAIGAKGLETRSWSTPYRGPLAIHASKRLEGEQGKLCIREPFFSVLTEAGFKVGWYVVDPERVYAKLPTGVIIATCNLVDCIKMTPEFINKVQRPELDFGKYVIGHYAWVLEDVKQLEFPVPAKGKLRIWEWEVQL